MERAGQPGMCEAPLCVMVHGINGLPDDLDELGVELRERGYLTEFLTLPGHRTSVRDFARHGWDEWLATVEHVVDAALGTGEASRPVFLVGHSLGAALALATASARPQVAGVVALCPPVRLASALEPALSVVKRVTPYLPALGEDIRDLRRRFGSRRETYRWTSTETLHSLVSALPGLRRQLPLMQAPTLVMAALHDHVVPVRDGREAYELLGSEYKRLVVLHRSFHAVARDVERHVVFEHVTAFCDEVMLAWPGRPTLETP